MQRELEARQLRQGRDRNVTRVWFIRLWLRIERASCRFYQLLLLLRMLLLLKLMLLLLLPDAQTSAPATHRRAHVVRCGWRRAT